MKRVVKTMAVDENNSIQKAFLDGIELVFSLMFTTHCKMYFLNEESVEKDIYDEVENKSYGEPVDLVAKVIYDHPKGEEPEETVIRKATIKIPTKQFKFLVYMKQTGRNSEKLSLNMRVLPI